MARCGRTIGDCLPRRRAWADISSDEDEEPTTVFAFQAPVPPTTVKAEETDSNSSLEVTRGGSYGSEEADRLSEAEQLEQAEPVEDLDQASSSSHAAWTAAPARVDAATSPRSSNGDVDSSDAPTARDARAVARQGMQMARWLREFAEEHPEPDVHDREMQTNLQSKDVEKLRNIRERLLAQRQAKEIQGLLPQREAEMEALRRAHRTEHETVRFTEMSEVLKNREAKAKQQAEELAALQEIQEEDLLDSPAKDQGNSDAQQRQEQIKSELQRVQAENQELLRAAQQVRSEDSGSQRQVQVLQAEVGKFQFTLHDLREGTAVAESELVQMQARKAEKLAALHDQQTQLKNIEEEHRVLEQQVKEEKQRSQQLENEKVSLQCSVKEAEEACRVWQWRLRKELCQIEKTEPNSNFVIQLLNKAPEVAEVHGSS
ncbi:unnamed protein product [Cladocopium goreaui]|uniref:Uncharacterized protein n=1 Tax=Cladocopium goreaui TaxID=2562237 RepID=A0A9P1CP33_9DINO|nr:unnamed protein product [Cladocopium goreaui]